MDQVISLPDLHAYCSPEAYRSGRSDTSKISPYTDTKMRLLSQPYLLNSFAVSTPTSFLKSLGRATSFGFSSSSLPNFIFISPADLLASALSSSKTLAPLPLHLVMVCSLGAVARLCSLLMFSW